jgi:hypothetical protein
MSGANVSQPESYLCAAACYLDVLIVKDIVKLAIELDGYSFPGFTSADHPVTSVPF